MALTDPDKQASLLNDVKFWLPDENILDDNGLAIIINLTITQVGDIDSQYAEVLCKSLKNAALKNNSSHLVDTASVISEKVGEVQKKWDGDSNKDIWLNYIESLKDICPIFGFIPTTGPIGIMISPSITPDINPDCPDISTLINADQLPFFL